MSKEKRPQGHPEEMNEHGHKHKHKRHHPFRNLLVLLLLGGIVALLLWRFGGFGWGYHEGQAEESGAATTAASQEATPAATTEAVTNEVAETPGETEGKTIAIIVGDDITIDGKTYADETALKDYLMSVHDEDTTIELVDDQARKAAYDLAQSVLEALNYTYSEKTK